MKHPAYRNSDILFVDPVWRDKAFNCVREGVELYIRKPLTEWLERSEAITGLTYSKEMKLQLVGSQAFGCAVLHSDWDFNLALKDWNAQAEARKWFFSGDNLKEFKEHITRFTAETGLMIQLGCVDPHSDDYNIYVDLDTMILHRRGSKLPHQTINDEIYTTNDRIPEVLPPVDLQVFDPLKDIAPPVAYQHLAWDGYAMRWLSWPNRRAMLRPAVTTQAPVALALPRWSQDEWIDEAKEWEDRYGDRYTGYNKINAVSDAGEPIIILEEIPCQVPR